MSSSSGSAATQYFSLRWNNHPVNLVSVFTGLYQAESLVDVSLAAEGKHLQAHKVVLSACSDYFQTLFAANPCQHPIVILKDISFEDLQTVVKFMYHGIVNVSSDKLPAVLKTADTLQIKGLEKNNELMAPYLSESNPRLLSVPQQLRQPSTESLPEYLHRSRSDAGVFPHHTLSSESRGMSFESQLEMSNQKRALSPTDSPSHTSSYARKKCRNRSGEHSAPASVDHGSMDDDRRAESPVIKTESRSGSTLTVPPHLPDPGINEHIAKKKRAMFQARKGGSGGSGSKSSLCNSSESRESREREEKKSHSSDKEDQGRDENTLQVPTLPQSRQIVRAVSVSNLSSHPSDHSTRFKRSRFQLRRQQCQETADDLETGTDTAGGPTLVKQRSQPVLPSQQTFSYSNSSSPRHSPPPASPPAPPDRQHSLDPLCGLESVPLLYSSTGPLPPRLPPSNLLRPTLPAVRVTSETPDPVQEVLLPGGTSPNHRVLSGAASPTHLYPNVGTYEQVSPPPGPITTQHDQHKHLARSRSTESAYVLHSSGNNNQDHGGLDRPHQTSMEQFGHCPKARDGPALSCNFCWNTTDGSGRILRRKTKYHCPECQTNLCIVPCFQQYHEAMEGEKPTIHGH